MCSARGYVRFTPESGHVRCKKGCLLWAISGLMHRSKTVLFDNLVGTSKQRCGNCEPERFSRDQVINLVKFGRLLDRNVGRYRSAQDLVDGAGGASEQVRVVCSIGHQTRRFDVVSSPMYC